jgi:hypothetical protein
MALTGDAQAQEPTPRPRPGEGSGNGNGSSGGSQDRGTSDGGEDSSQPLPPKTGVDGFIYNYSTAAYEGGVQVVATGNGWQAETVTDSNGYYELRELGFGKAILNLRLPPEAHAAAPNWPTTLIEPEGHQVDLGFYWDSPDSIPVLLSGRLEQGGEQIVVQLRNNTNQPATGGLVEIVTPSNLKIAPAIKTSQGQLSNFAAHRTQVEPGEIMPGKTATISANLSLQTEVSAQSDAVVQVLFTYHEQISPQAIELALNEALIQAESSSNGSGANLPDARQAEPAPEAAVSQNETATPSQATPQAADFASPPSTAESSTMPADAPDEANNDSLLPGTGNGPHPINTAVISTLTVLLLVVLGFGGWQSLRGRQT